MIKLIKEFGIYRVLLGLYTVLLEELGFLFDNLSNYCYKHSRIMQKRLEEMRK